MNNIFRILLCLLFINSCFGMPTDSIPLHPIILQTKQTSLYSKQVDWQEVNTNFIKLIKDKQSIEEQKDALQYLINSLGDKHASIRLAKDHSIVVSYTGAIMQQDKRERKSEFINDVINDISSRFSYQLLNGNIGYLKVVGIGPGNVKEQADFIRKGLIALKAKSVDKWILDLRYNGGGNMEPMLSGLAPLLGDGYIGGAVDFQNERTREYIIKDGQFNNTGRLVCKMENLPKIEKSEKVAVLLSRYTISSGELVAIAFKKRVNTRFIGEATAGYTTGNGYTPVNEDLILTISQDVFIDRENIKYDRVEVDEEVEFQHNTDLKNDKQLSKAIEWLERK